MGHEAYSCDIEPCSGGHPEWHLQQDVLPLLNGKCEFKTTDGMLHNITDRWDMMIAFPPCTYLTVTANRWYKPEYEEKYPTRKQDRADAISFFMALVNAPIERIAIENPVGIMSSKYRKPDQIIQPWQFGDAQIKKTCLWLTPNMPILKPTNIVEPLYKEYNSSTKASGKSRYPMLWTVKGDAKARSKTFQGIARAMAEQWG